MFMAKLAQDAGFPDGSVNIIHGGVDGMLSWPSLETTRVVSSAWAVSVLFDCWAHSFHPFPVLTFSCKLCLR